MILLMLAVAGEFVAAESGVAASVSTNGDLSCTQPRAGITKVATDVYVQKFEHVSNTGTLAASPDRVEFAPSPGSSGATCVGYQNRTGAPIRLAFSAVDLGTVGDGVPQPVDPGSTQFGAASWLKIPTAATGMTLNQGDILWMVVRFTTPADTVGGSAYAAVFGETVQDSGAQTETAQSTTRVLPGVYSQIFFNVPGATRAGGNLIDVESDRLIWWDGVRLGRIGALEKLRGPGVASFRFKWRNDGSYSQYARPTIRVRSSLTGREVARFDFPNKIVVRGGARPFDVIWKRDIPFVGRFTPTLTVQQSDGKTITKQLPAIWVIPAWWYFVALVLAIGFPLWLRRRSQRRYYDLLARLESAEQASGDWDHGAY